MAKPISQLKSLFKASKRDWDQSCQAAVRWISYWTGGFKQDYGSAILAYRASRIVSKNPLKAPINAVHFWDCGIYGHVAVSLGAGRCVMASKHVDTKWGTNIGETTVARYTARTGLKYLGWAKTDGKNTMHITVPKPKSSTDAKKVKKLATYLNKMSAKYGWKMSTTAARDGERGKVYWTLIQKLGKHDKLYGDGYLVDGNPGTKDSRTRWLEKHYYAKA